TRRSGNEVEGELRDAATEDVVEAAGAGRQASDGRIHAVHGAVSCRVGPADGTSQTGFSKRPVSDAPIRLTSRRSKVSKRVVTAAIASSTACPEAARASMGKAGGSLPASALRACSSH